MAKEVTEVLEKEVAAILGILSVVLAFFQPLAGIVLGIIGLVQNRQEKSKTAKRLNIIGIIIGVIVLAITIWLSFYLANQTGSQGFPIY